MALPNRAGYAVSALFDLAFHAGGRAAQAREIAERQVIPLRYLEQILQDLRRAGLIEAKRGPRGGYVLAVAPAAIRLTDVLAAVEEAPDRLLEPSTEVQQARTSEGVVDVPALVWRELSAQVWGLLGAVTLGDMVSRAEALGVSRAAPAPQMYFI